MNRAGERDCPAFYLMTNLLPEELSHNKKVAFLSMRMARYFFQVVNLRDAGSHQVSHCEILLRMQAFNGILLAVITSDRGWPFDIEAITQAFLAGLCTKPSPAFMLHSRRTARVLRTSQGRGGAQGACYA